MNRPQVPGRAEALRLVVQQGIANASPDLRQLAGIGRRHVPRPREINVPTQTFTGGADNLSPAEREALPF